MKIEEKGNKNHNICRKKSKASVLITDNTYSKTRAILKNFELLPSSTCSFQV